MFILIPNKYLSIPNEKGKYGKGSKNSCENYLFKDSRLDDFKEVLFGNKKAGLLTLPRSLTTKY